MSQLVNAVAIAADHHHPADGVPAALKTQKKPKKTTTAPPPPPPRPPTPAHCPTNIPLTIVTGVAMEGYQNQRPVYDIVFSPSVLTNTTPAGNRWGVSCSKAPDPKQFSYMSCLVGGGVCDMCSSQITSKVIDGACQYTIVGAPLDPKIYINMICEPSRPTLQIVPLFYNVQDPTTRLAMGLNAYYSGVCGWSAAAIEEGKRVVDDGVVMAGAEGSIEEGEEDQLLTVEGSACLLVVGILMTAFIYYVKSSRRAKSSLSESEMKVSDAVPLV